jgi:hypothetical protein
MVALAAGGLALAVAVGAQSPGPEVVGRWDAGPTVSFVPRHMHVLPTGEVLLNQDGDLTIWNPTTGNPPSSLPNHTSNIFCSGHCFLADGKLLVTGGHIENSVGLDQVSIFDPLTRQWQAQSRMNAGRWYPTNTTLANGDVLIVSGDVSVSQGVNRLPQVYQAATGTLRSLSSALLSLDLYPAMHLAPNGRVFNSGPSTDTRYLDTAGTGAWSLVARRNGPWRDFGSSVMYEPGKVLVMGGGDPPTASAEVIDLNGASPAWRTVGSMAQARRQLNATILPDGTVLVTGGTRGAGFNNQDPGQSAYAAEVWNPATEQWRTLASATKVRVYHSTAALLPDGRVLSGGGDGQYGTEVFSPPYLFRGARPTITTAPTAIAYGQTFPVQTPDAAAVSQVTLVALSSVTHAFNQHQRFLGLTFTATASGLDVEPPSVSTLAPPGPYMLFLLDGNGVPSVARIVLLGTTAPPPPSTTLTVSPTTVAPGATVTATWSGIESPTSTDWLGLYAAGAADSAFLARMYVSCSQTPGAPRASGSCGFPIPDTLATGAYELRLFANDGFTRLATSNAFGVATGGGGGATLTVSPTTVAAGEAVTATWSGIASPTATDWIGLYAPGTADSEFLAWIYVSCSQVPGAARAAGSCSFPIPRSLAPGVYELHLLGNNGTVRLATSNGFTVTSPTGGPTLTVTPTSVAAGGSVTATWTGIESPTGRDWIGLYAPGAANSAYLAWLYVSCSQVAGVARASGSCSFPIPGSLAAGTYELRLFANDRFTRLATSNPLTVTGGGGGGPTLTVSPTTVAAGASITATWSGIASPTARDWIGLYAPGTANSAYRAWLYVSCSQVAGAARASGSCSFPIPGSLAAGTYELRLFTNDSSTRLATSPGFTVTGP